MKNKTTAGVLALFLGGIGAHKFYLGKPGQGIAYALLCWTFIPAAVSLVEAILLFSMSDEAFAQKYASETDQYSIVSPKTHIVCPDCRELIRKGAVKCRFCGCALARDQ